MYIVQGINFKGEDNNLLLLRVPNLLGSHFLTCVSAMIWQM